jgi:hypothetical protein
MELSPARQKLLFVVIVLALAVVGYVLVVPALHKKNAAPAPSASPSTPAGPAPSTAAPAAPVATTVPAGSVNIYDWLPFTQQGLGEAAALATQFAKDYDTFTYTESATSYTNAMGGLITTQLAAILQNAYSTSGVANLRTSQKQTSTATASIVSLRAFGSSSLTFIVSIAQKLATSNGTSNSNTQYSVTLTGSATGSTGQVGSWQVSDVELANQGNT